jgi:hypothetical protein
MVTQLAIGDVRQMVAYCESDSDGFTQIRFFDLTSQTYSPDLDLGTRLFCRLGGFSREDNGLLAISLLNGNSLVQWQLLLVDPASGETVYELNSKSPLLDTIEMLEYEMQMPAVRRVADGQVEFVMCPMGVMDAPCYGSFAWDYTADTLGTAEPMQNILATTDPDRPSAELIPGGYSPSANVVTSIDESGASQEIYHSPDAFVIDLEWINGGQEMAIALLTYPNYQWITLDRSGTVTELIPPTPDLVSVIGTADGYALWGSVLQEDGSMLYTLDYVVDGDSSTLWSGSVTTNGPVGIDIVWVTPVTVPDDLPPFPSIE